MAKKKTTKVSEKSTSFQQAIGIDNIFHNERINFVLGFCLLFIAGYLTWAFASFLVTGEADQSMIEVPRAGEILNQNQEFQNACGSLGAYAALFRFGCIPNPSIYTAGISQTHASLSS